MSSRRPFVGGNWKLNGNTSFCNNLVVVLNSDSRLSSIVSTVDVMVAPPFLYLDLVNKQKGALIVSAQNCADKDKGAFTGEVSSSMLLDCGIHWTILGHSERRNVYGETDAMIANKVALCMSTGLSVVLCVGEKLDERQAGATSAVILAQLSAVIAMITDWSRVVIAYEPVWAIGTGLSATPEQAVEAHQILRNYLSANVSATVASTVRIIYGGSVTAANAASLSAAGGDIDGFLVGGASLKQDDFLVIASAMKRN